MLRRQQELAVSSINAFKDGGTAATALLPSKESTCVCAKLVCVSVSFSS